MKKMRRILIGVICVMMVFPSVVWAGNKPLDYGWVIIDTKTVPKCSYGEKVTITIPLKNNENVDVTNVMLEPVPKASAEEYPFTTTKTNVYQYVEGIEKSKEAKLDFEFTVSKDVLTKEYPVEFQLTYSKNVGTEESPSYKDVRFSKTIYVRVTGKPEEVTVTPTVTPEDTNGGGDSSDSGDGGNMGDSSSSSEDSSDSSDSKKTGTPRVIVDGFRTEPQTINAGETFKLILKVRNTSKKTAISNMEINLEANGTSSSSSSDSDDGVTAGTASDIFMPVKGSNTLFVDSIGADKTEEVAIDLTARADLTQKPYQLAVSMKYEDVNAQQYEAASTISIPIKQKARFDVSTIQVSPESIMVGEEGNVNFNINNKGRTKLYNVSVQLESDTITGGDTYVGNLESGASSNVDLMVTGAQETEDEGEVKIVISYEDQDGKPDAYETTCNLYVMPASMETDGIIDDMVDENANNGMSLWMILGIVVAVLVVVGSVIAVIIKRKHKKEEDFADEIFGSDKDE